MVRSALPGQTRSRSPTCGDLTELDTTGLATSGLATGLDTSELDNTEGVLMSDSFEVAQSSSEDELTDEQRHEVVAAQLRGEAKAEGQGPDAVVAAVAAELEDLGLEPDPTELHRRYEEIDPDIPELTGADDVPPADQGTGATTTAADGPVSAGVEGGRDHAPVDDPEADPDRR